MSKYCTQCGSEISEYATSCNYCGKVFGEDSAAQTVALSEHQYNQAANNQQNAYGQYNQPNYNQQNTYGQYNQSQYGQQTQYNPQYYYPNGNYGAQQTNAPTGTSVGGWIGWLLLCSFIPLIGQIIVMCCAKDDSTKNWAKAQLIMTVIGVVLVLLMVVGFGMSFAEMMDVYY